MKNFRKISTIALAFMGLLVTVFCRANWQSNLDRELISAIERNQPEVVKALLKRGANPNTLYTQRSTAETNSKKSPNPKLSKVDGSVVRYAIYHDYVDCTLALVSHPSLNVHQRLRFGESLLMRALMRHNPELSQELLAKGGWDINERLNGGSSLLQMAIASKCDAIGIELMDLGAGKSDTPTMRMSMLKSVAEAGCERICKRLLETGIDLSHETDPDRPLKHAALAGNLGIVKLLMEHGSKADIPQDDFRPRTQPVDDIHGTMFTPLTNAAIRNKLSIVQYLVEHGADVNRVCKSSTAIQLAAQSKSWDAVKYLAMHGAKVRFEGKLRYDGSFPPSPIFAAVEDAKVDIVEMLITRGTPVDILDNHFLTPLIEAARYDNLELAKLLIDHGANINYLGGNRNRSPLMMAADRGKVRMVKYLISRGADVNLHGDVYRRYNLPYSSALGFSEQNGQDEVVKILKAAGAK